MLLTKKRKFNYYSAKPSSIFNYKYASFDGVNDYVKLNKKILLTGNFTFTIWFYRFDSTSNDFFLGTDNTDSTIIAGKIGLMNDNRLFVRSKAVSTSVAGGGNMIGDIGYHNNLNAQWNFLAVRRTGTVIEASLNGNNFVTLGSVNGYVPDGTLEFIHLGLDEVSSTNYFAGHLREIKIWDKSLTLVEIQITKDLTYSTPQPNLIGYYKFINNLLDTSGNNNHGTAYNGALFSGDVARYATFDAVNDYVDLSPHIIPLADKSLSNATIEMWIRPNTLHTNTGGVLFAFQNDKILSTSSSETLVLIYGNATSNLTNEVITITKFKGGASNGELVASYGYQNSATSKFLNNWFHIAFVFKPNQWQMYVNGELVNITKATNFNYPVGTYIQDLVQMKYCYIGGRFYQNNYQSMFNGSIANFRYWKVARTGQEILDNKNKYIQQHPNLLVNLKLKGDALDASGNNYNGTPYNGVIFN